MNTFLPSRSYAASAQMIDDARLSNQRNEGVAILRALIERRGYVHHPATKMWAGHEGALMFYVDACCTAAVRRDIADSLQPKLRRVMRKLLDRRGRAPFEPPVWLGDKLVHTAYRSALLRKSEHYQQFGWRATPDLPYFWPVLDDYHPDGYWLRVAKADRRRIADGLLRMPAGYVHDKDGLVIKLVDG